MQDGATGAGSVGATWTKGRQGGWLVRAAAGMAGCTVSVTRRNGASAPITLGREVWSGDGVALYTVAGKGGTQQGRSAAGRSAGSSSSSSSSASSARWRSSGRAWAQAQQPQVTQPQVTASTPEERGAEADAWEERGEVGGGELAF